MIGVAMARFWVDAWTSLRARLSFRLVRRAVLAALALSSLTIGIEALIRARLEPALDRLPTALYTRPEPWQGSAGGPRGPVAIASVDGSPLERRIPVRLDNLPEHLVDAVLAVEDQRFYTHHGLDVRRIGGAMVANLKARAIVQGGSTVTQQLAKNLFLTARRTPLRKAREAAMAIVLELRYDKAAILEAYLNEIYLGHDGARAIHGVGAAARFHFGKDARSLNLAESALLAGMIYAPNRHTPSRNPAAARARRDLVLGLMVRQQRISQRVADRARRPGVPRRPSPGRVLDGRHFMDVVRPGIGRLPRRGVAVYTTLDAGLQRTAERAVRAGLARLRAPGAEAALVALDPRSGEVLALVGGREYGASQFNRVTEARRQPGSAFKPIVALAALERAGRRDPTFTLASVVEDEPLRIRTPSGPWQPTNYDGRFRGPVTFREAMEQSLNVPFARIGLLVGPSRIVETARRLGITSPLHPVPSLALGSSEVTLLELVRAYGVLAASGDLVSTRTVLATARFGDTVAVGTEPTMERVIDPAVAYLVTSTLEGAVTRGTGRALNADHRFEAVAGKTGTTNDWRDAWFIAYTPSLAVGVWVGYDDGRSLGMSGAGAALPIVAQFLEQARTGGEWEPFEMPDGITEGYVTLAHGGWFSECGSRELFLAGTEPDGGGCFRFDQPSWDGSRDWGRRFSRRAQRFLDELAEELEEIRGRR